MEKIWLKNYDCGVPHSMNYPNITLHQMLENSASRFPDHTAMIFPGRFGDSCRLRYKELDQEANRLANAHLTTKLVYEMQRRKARYGMVTMCTGGGMGAAGIFEIAQ